MPVCVSKIYHLSSSQFQSLYRTYERYQQRITDIQTRLGDNGPVPIPITIPVEVQRSTTTNKPINETDLSNSNPNRCTSSSSSPSSSASSSSSFSSSSSLSYRSLLSLHSDLSSLLSSLSSQILFFSSSFSSSLSKLSVFDSRHERLSRDFIEVGQEIQHFQRESDKKEEERREKEEMDREEEKRRESMGGRKRAEWWSKEKAARVIQREKKLAQIQKWREEREALERQWMVWEQNCETMSNGLLVSLSSLRIAFSKEVEERMKREKSWRRWLMAISTISVTIMAFKLVIAAGDGFG